MNTGLKQAPMRIGRLLEHREYSDQNLYFYTCLNQRVNLRPVFIEPIIYTTFLR